MTTHPDCRDGRHLTETAAPREEGDRNSEASERKFTTPGADIKPVQTRGEREVSRLLAILDELDREGGRA